MRRQIVEEAPLTFLDAGITPSPAVEAVSVGRSPRSVQRGSRRSPSSLPHSVPQALADLRRPRHAPDALAAASQTLFEALVAKTRPGPRRRSLRRQHR